VTRSGPRWLARLSRQARRDRSRNPRERSLEEAADRLGVQLAEYYPDDPYDHEETRAQSGDQALGDRVDASREELLAYIAASRARRRGRRLRILRAMLGGALAIVATVLVAREVVSGTPSNGGAGKPPAHWSQEVPSVPPPNAGPGVPRLAPEVSIELPVGPIEAVASAFVDLRGDICTSIAFSENGLMEGQAGADCRPSARIARLVRRRGAGFALSVERGGAVLASGYARADLERIAIAGPRAGTDKAISDVWSVGSTGRPGLKVFLIRLASRVGAARLTGVFRDGSRLPIASAPRPRR
jgi:hypothetical protein